MKAIVLNDVPTTTTTTTTYANSWLFRRVNCLTFCEAKDWEN